MMDSVHAREVRRDILVVVTGVALVLLSLWVPVNGDQQITGSILVLGLVAYSAGLWAMTTESRASHVGLVVLGAMLLLSPLAMNFPRGTTAAATIAVVAGVIIAGVGILGLLARRDQPVAVSREPEHQPA
ncbi:SPW repeat domain-containing protein [Rhodococcus spelaei]|nr:hypothetical protein [Rhodococcus spelaei]